MFTSLVEKIDILEPLIVATGKPELMSKAKFLYDRISNPESFVVFLGETSSGKSSIINGLIGAQLLPVKAFPSTASITEIVFKYGLSEIECYSISKDAKMKLISKEEFCTQCETTSPNLERLRAHVGTSNKVLNNMRVFDTPGYGARVDAHEEILKEFIPNSDIVIYTVSYKEGIKAYDYSFLGFLRELLLPTAKVILLINRCPIGLDECSNSRIKEIKRYVSDLLAIDPQVFCIENVVSADEMGHPMPKCETMWKYVGNQISTVERKRMLFDSFNEYIHDLYIECDSVIQIQYREALLSNDDLYKIRIAQREFARNIRLAAHDLVEPSFERIKSKLPHYIDLAENRIIESIMQKISDADRLGKDEMVAYTNSHLLPFTIKKEMGEVIQYIDVELSDLNKHLDDYIQKEIVRFEGNVEVILDSNFDSAVKSIAQEYVKRTMGNALSKYFLSYAGAAGLRGGAANAASHSLKVIGGWFGKTFSKETHIMMQRIGATVAKGLGAAIAIVTEILFEAYDLTTWKLKLKKKVRKGVACWKEDTIPMILKDMDELLETNISTLNIIANQMEDSIEDISNNDIDVLKQKIELSESIKQQLAY